MSKCIRKSYSPLSLWISDPHIMNDVSSIERDMVVGAAQKAMVPLWLILHSTIFRHTGVSSVASYPGKSFSDPYLGRNNGYVQQ